jgi:hypothetical protein
MKRYFSAALLCLVLGSLPAQEMTMPIPLSPSGPFPSGEAAIQPSSPEMPAAVPLQAWNEDPAALVGMTLDDLYKAFGPPLEVYASRGEVDWQDDVVFVYNETAPAEEYYIYRNRVWQVKVASFQGINTGDKRGVIPLVLGEAVTETTDYSAFPLQGYSWPMSLRFAVTADGTISDIYIYRNDM